MPSHASDNSILGAQKSKGFARSAGFSAPGQQGATSRFVAPMLQGFDVFSLEMGEEVMGRDMERVIGLEPTTSTLARSRSTN